MSEVIDMDVFQVLTLCFLLSVMFLGVLSYGLYRNWQRNQLELVRVPAGRDEFSDLTETPERIYPRVNVSEPSTSLDVDREPVVSPSVSVRRNTFVELRENNRATGSIEDSPTASPEEPVEDKASAPSDGDHTTDSLLGPLSKRPQLVQDKIAVEANDSSESSEESNAVDDGLDRFRYPRGVPTTKEIKKRTSRKQSFSSKKATRIERKPPLRSKRKKEKQEGSSHSDSAGRHARDEFIVLFVLGEHDTSFRMSEISRFLLSKDLVVDDMGLFCKKDQTTGEVLFKVADVFYPGTFDVDSFETYRTAGISLVMRTPNVSNARDVFEHMLVLANDCAETFSGAVKDENYNAMSNQTLAHYRQRVSEFRRRQLTMFA